MQQNSAFAHVIQTPFYFNLASQTLDSQNIADELPQEEDILCQYLVEKFVDIKLTRLPDKNFPSPEKSKLWLSWLAKILSKGNTVVFELSTLQPSMVLSPRRYRFVHNFAVGFYIAFCFYFCLMPIVLLALPRDLWLFPYIISALLVCSFIGLMWGGTISLIGGLGLWDKNYDFKTEDVRQWKLSKAFSLQTWISTLKFIFKGFVRGLIYGAIVVSASGLISSVISLNFNWLFFFPMIGAMFGSVGGLSFGLVTGLLDQLYTIKDFYQTRSPLQKLKSGSLYHPIKWSLILSLPLFIIEIFSRGDLSLKRFSLVLLFGAFGLFVGFASTPFFKHLVLRYYLYKHEGSIPLKYINFLNYATELRILERDGGQWRFRHQILQNHFAELTKVDPQDSDQLRYFR
jgi:hypothetical protein